MKKVYINQGIATSDFSLGKKCFSSFASENSIVHFLGRKKKVATMLVFAFFALFMVSCDLLNDEGKSFDKSLLYGTWRSGTLYYSYTSEGVGATWDTSDDVTEAEGQAFTWTLIGDQLMQLHVLEMGSSVPKTYTVTTLTETSLEYKDGFGVSYSFVKVEF
ncbi:MAG: hypothetical protein GXX78_15310 [Bacteroidales bacterium]|nr:hypothetical protein [Bacteroidales bacterium]